MPKLKFVPWVKPENRLPGPLSPIPGEFMDEHRAFMLWCMQDEQYRSQRMTGHLLGKTDGYIRAVRKRRNWDERIAQAGVGVHTRAIQQYFRHHSIHWPMDAPAIERRMSVPFRADFPMPDPVPIPGKETPNQSGPVQRANAASQLATEASDPDHKDGQSKTRQEYDFTPSKIMQQRFKKLIEAVLGQAASSIKDMKISPRDIPSLVRAYNELDAILSGQVDVSGGPTLKPSVRVQDAVNTGGSITEAMLQDAQECVAILEGIEASKLVAAQVAEQRETAGG